MNNKFKENIETILYIDYGKAIRDADTISLYNAVSKAAMLELREQWNQKSESKKACYLSAEFLVGRLVYANLYNMGLMEQLKEMMEENGRDTGIFEDIEDAALGNGGLGRLAACFLDSAASLGLSMDGYGLRYKYGLFKQQIEDGFQKELPDNWQSYGDPWSVRREDEKLTVCFGDQTVYAVPYDTPVIGYGRSAVNTLRLWQAEPAKVFDFELFNEQKYDLAVIERDNAEAITSLLYPNDSTDEGKKLRLKQEYFFTSATMQDLVRQYKKKHGDDFRHFSSEYAIQLNDTHPVAAIPELIRLLTENGTGFEQALRIAGEAFAFTNHTIMAEAMEKWSVPLFKEVLPHVYEYVAMIDNALKGELVLKGITGTEQERYLIISDNTIHMARLAVFVCHSTNGVAGLHTEILKKDVLKEWYGLYPERFNNKTNGITQRRWLALANMELSEFITGYIGKSWITQPERLKELEPLADDRGAVKEFCDIKQIKKKQLAEYILKKENVRLDPGFIFDIQIKRLHEYKRQLLNAFSILDIYFGLKDGRIADFYPTAFIFGGKAAPGYYRAKAIIKLISEIAGMINNDPEVSDRLRVVFVSNYNVSYAEKLIPAADISEQISTAGTEASGTGNMKFMLNGAVTLGTYDGANIEIAEHAGEENNYIFGARVRELERLKDSYNPVKLYEETPGIKRVLDALTDGTLSDNGTGMFGELYNSILKGASWHKPDHYYLLLDFLPYVKTKLRANRDYSDRYLFGRKGLINTANAGSFSSDITISRYAEDIWGLQ